MELEVVQNFAITGPNRGHLCVEADVLRPPPVLSGPVRVAPTTPGRLSPTTRQVRAWLLEGPQTVFGMKQRLGASRHVIHAALNTLRSYGGLKSQVTAMDLRTNGYQNGATREYWLERT